MQWNTFCVQIQKKNENMPCKNEDFWSKMAKNDQYWVILTFDPIFRMNLYQIGSMD